MNGIFKLEDKIAYDIISAQGVVLKQEDKNLLESRPTEQVIKADKPEEATILYKKALEADPSYAEAIFKFAMFEDKLGHR